MAAGGGSDASFDQRSQPSSVFSLASREKRDGQRAARSHLHHHLIAALHCHSGHLVLPVSAYVHRPMSLKRYSSSWSNNIKSRPTEILPSHLSFALILAGLPSLSFIHHAPHPRTPSALIRCCIRRYEIANGL
jgi:hypothetical protein